MNSIIVAGGGFDESVGYFIEPTVVETTSKDAKIFKEELFGPVVTAFVYKGVVHQILSPISNSESTIFFNKYL